MAPENPPSLVIFDARIEDDNLLGSCEYIEPSAPGGRLRVRWAVESQPEGFSAVAGGVAYVDRDREFSVVPVSKDARPVSLGDDRYRWVEGLNAGVPWVMFILVLPRGHTLSEPSPAPAGARVFQERLALYWVLRGDDLGRTHVAWTLKPLLTDPKTELTRLNKLLVAGSIDTAPLAIDDISRVGASKLSPPVQPRDDFVARALAWMRGNRTIALVIVLGIVLIALGQTTQALENLYSFVQKAFGGSHSGDAIRSPAQPTSYMSALELDVNYQGHDLSNFQVKDANSCSRICEGDKNCKAMTFVPTPAPTVGICWLKDSVPTMSRAQGMVSAVKIYR